jgi:hypothetical protein
MNHLISQLSQTFDVDRMRTEAWYIVKTYGFNEDNQINLTNLSGASRDEFAWKYTGKLAEQKVDGRNIAEHEFTEFHPDLIGTYMHEVFKSLPYKCGRFRLMRIKPKTCYSVHNDVTMRLHLAVVTNPSAFMVFPQYDYLTHIPADGHLYLTDTTRMHTAMNCGPEDRLHFVASLI